jgi:ATP-dependent helicase/nuclease subunit B
LSGRDYADLFASLSRAKSLRPQRATHPRLTILGPLEARLIDADLVILGGMNEGVWPPETEADPWMSRPMRQDFGLPSPEFRIGLSAHDFVQLAASGREVMITRAARSGGAQTTSSRFLLQMEAVLRAAGLCDNGDPLAPALPWAAWARGLDNPGPAHACARPTPRPPVEARPQKLSVTEITTWMRNPYAIYARHVLGLRKLDDLDAPLDASDRGTMIHAALEQFVRAHQTQMPPDAEDKLVAIGREVFAKEVDDPRVQAFWWPRFCDIAKWFVTHEAKRRADGISPLGIECKGEMSLGSFKLTGKADRIDRDAEGKLTVVDYKTGGMPKRKHVEQGLEPQLQLLALMAERGAFAEVAPNVAAALEYWALKGGRGKSGTTEFKKNVDGMVADAIDGLQNLIDAFAKPDTAYIATPSARRAPKYNDYEHLSRQKEWGQAGGDE